MLVALAPLADGVTAVAIKFPFPQERETCQGEDESGCLGSSPKRNINFGKWRRRRRVRNVAFPVRVKSADEGDPSALVPRGRGRRKEQSVRAPECGDINGERGAKNEACNAMTNDDAEKGNSRWKSGHATSALRFPFGNRTSLMRLMADPYLGHMPKGWRRIFRRRNDDLDEERRHARPRAKGEAMISRASSSTRTSR